MQQWGNSKHQRTDNHFCHFGKSWRLTHFWGHVFRSVLLKLKHLIWRPFSQVGSGLQHLKEGQSDLSCLCLTCWSSSFKNNFCNKLYLVSRAHQPSYFSLFLWWISESCLKNRMFDNILNKLQTPLCCPYQAIQSEHLPTYSFICFVD